MSSWSNKNLQVRYVIAFLGIPEKKWPNHGELPLPDQDSSDDDEKSTSNAAGTSLSKESMFEVDNQVNKDSDEKPAPRKRKQGHPSSTADRKNVPTTKAKTTAYCIYSIFM